MSKAKKNSKTWRFAIDRGGTFTDVVARSSTGDLVTRKLLSENPAHYSDSVIQGIRDVLKVGSDDPLPLSSIAEVRLGTTLGTNALLERKGGKTALLITKGHRDALEIGYQDRPDIFARAIKKPSPLYETVIEVEERIEARGKTRTALNEAKLHKDCKRLKRLGFNSIAIVFIHGYKHPRHEVRAARIAAGVGFAQISTSHEVSPLAKFVRRGDTTVLDAYLAPVLHQYLQSLREQLKGISFLLMQSNGALVRADRFRAKDSLLSGPAGGVIGAVQTTGKSTIIGFDMGGTSTDVWHYGGDFERVFESTVADVRLQVPMLKIETIAAGGGSVLKLAGGRAQVGPESVGAHPGPVCYGQGGGLALTDANVLLNRINADLFPKVFGADGEQSIDLPAVEKEFSNIQKRFNSEFGKHRSKESIAAGFLEIANTKMAEAIRKISTAEGHDLRKYSLACFGGAAGLHACDIAERLGISEIIVSRFAGVLSATGIGQAHQGVRRQHSVEKTLAQLTPNLLNQYLRKAIKQSELEADQAGFLKKRHQISFILRYVGSETTIALTMSKRQLESSRLPVSLRRRYQRGHSKRFGFIDTKEAIELQFIEIETWQPEIGSRKMKRPAQEKKVNLARWQRVYLDRWRRCRVWLSDELNENVQIEGPAVVYGPNETLLIKPYWSASFDGHRLRLVFENSRQASTKNEVDDPMMLEVFNRAFESLAGQMGEVLRSASRSVNIRERLDFSCALFNSRGDLIVNAPHIPVHLGSMSAGVKAIIEKFGSSMREGDAFLGNNPFAGGTHLPDVTLITPFFVGRKAAYYLASRGHHAEIGGISPGSMPSNSASIHEEGVIIDNVLVMRDFRFDEALLRGLLGSGPFPSRDIETNVADVKAKVAANQHGIRELGRLLALYGHEVVEAYVEKLLDNSAQAVAELSLPRARLSSDTCLDSGDKVHCTITKNSGRLRFDFAKSSPQSSLNLNAPMAISRAAVLYCLRLLLAEDIPLNDGMLRNVDIVILRGSLLNPDAPAAVVAGNVETSQAIVDTIMAALKLMAGSQGTMNNLTIGNKKFQYYETICGGAGAGATFAGADAVQTHMTNSRITDIEVLERRFPIHIRRFAISKAGSGRGLFHGGSGVVREIEFLKPAHVELNSNHRIYPPKGLAGGSDGSLGLNTFISRNGTRKRLPPSFSRKIAKGDAIVIETPGGGGYGDLKG